MTGFCRKTICLFIALLFIFTLSIPAFLGKSKIKTTLDAAVNEYHLTPCSICNPPSFESEAEIAAEPVEPDLNKTTRPANGEVLYSKNKTRPSTLTFENNTNYDCLVTLVNGSNTEVLQFYVRKAKDATVDIPTGKLFLQIAYGSTWKNPTELFGKNTNYESGDGELDVGKGEDWTFTFGE